MSASSTPTRAPWAAQASARFAATVDLPTPPLPEATATIFLTPGNGFSGRCTACAWICEVTSKSTGSPPASRSSCGRSACVRTLGVAPYGKSEAQSDAYAAFAQLHLINGVSRSQGLAQKGIGVMLDGGADLVQTRIVHAAIMAWLCPQSAGALWHN